MKYFANLTRKYLLRFLFYDRAAGCRPAVLLVRSSRARALSKIPAVASDYIFIILVLRKCKEIKIKKIKNRLNWIIVRSNNIVQ